MFGTEKDRRVNRGSYRAAGVGVAIAGKRADLGIIDDPFRSREDADSIVIRDKNWNWYLADFRTRLKPNGRIIIINTRWHEDDICGRILPESYGGESGWIRARDGEWWFVISIQALCERDDDILGREPGQSYWPTWYTQAMLEQERIVQTARNWSALYQQRPSPEEGDYYKREWFQWYDELPKNGRVYGASDYAVTDDGGDWTVHVVGQVFGQTMMEDLYLTDYWTGQKESNVWIDRFIDLVLLHQPVEWAEETGQIAKSLGPMIDTEQLRRQAWTTRTAFPTVGDKAQRGQTFRALCAQRRVFLPRHAPWAKDLLDRLLRWQTTGRDDDHDACALLGRMIYGMRGGTEKSRGHTGPKYGTFDYLMKVTDPNYSNKPSKYRSN
jgi:predicted phage terminase large subunit-like protein